MSKHTPGPWKVFTNPDGTKAIGIGDQNGEGVTDCGFGIWRGGSEEALANARLIAAAPELLGALRALRGWCIPGMNWTDSIGQELLKIADEAIAKASTETRL